MLSRVVLLCSLVGPLVAQTGAWSQQFPATSPVPADEQAMAHHSGLGVTVLYGAGRTSETWTWDGAAWFRASTLGPSGRDVHSMVYDSGRNRLVMVHAPSGFLEVWEWTSGWTRITTTTSPPTRNHFSLAYDSGRGVTVLFGGTVGGNEKSDTWEYDGNDWTQRASGGPSPRYNARMAYDAARSQVVLFGGEQDNSPTTLGDTWAWNGSAWIEFFGVTGPAVRKRHAMAYDSVRQRIVVFGGWASSGPVRGSWDDTWEWDGSAWTLQVTPVRPAPGPGWSMAYDPARQKMVLFGGPGETWEYMSLPSVSAQWTPFGTSCQGTGGTPLLTTVGGSLPVLGQTFQTQLAPVSTSPLTAPYMVLGSSNTVYGPLQLPANLGLIGATGCMLSVSIDILVPLPKVGTTATFGLQIPSQTSLLGAGFHMQGLLLDPGANALSLVTSDAGTATVGT